MYLNTFLFQIQERLAGPPRAGTSPGENIFPGHYVLLPHRHRHRHRQSRASGVSSKTLLAWGSPHFPSLFMTTWSHFFSVTPLVHLAQFFDWQQLSKPLWVIFSQLWHLRGASGRTGDFVHAKPVFSNFGLHSFLFFWFAVSVAWAFCWSYHMQDTYCKAHAVWLPDGAPSANHVMLSSMSGQSETVKSDKEQNSYEKSHLWEKTKNNNPAHGGKQDLFSILQHLFWVYRWDPKWEGDTYPLICQGI